MFLKEFAASFLRILNTLNVVLSTLNCRGKEWANSVSRDSFLCVNQLHMFVDISSNFFYIHIFTCFCPGERKQSFQFTVHTESSWNKRADWVFAGQSEREMKEWIAAFKVNLNTKFL